MGFSNLMKRLKKRLRNKKRWLALGSFLLIALAALLSSSGDGGGMFPQGGRTGAVLQNSDPGKTGLKTPAADRDEAAKSRDTEQAWQEIIAGGKPREVLLVKSYVCGEETQKWGTKLPGDLIRYREKHPDIQASYGPNGEIFLTEKIDDLSPRCKQDAYFGLDKKGNLSLFDGLPSRDQVIRTFFQLNVELLKSGLPQETVTQLYNGIKIADLAEYNSVISTFADYAVNGKSRM
jgi:forespore regulator of the sigma-K checkpoint